MIKKSLALLSLLVLLLFAGQLVLANEVSDRGSDMRELYSRRSVLQKDVRALKAKVAILGSLASIEERAASLGFLRQTMAADFLALPKLAQAQ